MEEAARPKEVNKIQTFVFMDLEATGLKRDNPRIVELSMIAVSRDHLLEMKRSITPRSVSPPDEDESVWSSQGSNGHTSNNSNSTDVPRKNCIPKLPRVVHKYTRLYYPWKLMPPYVEEINGLSNYDLEHLPSFHQASAQALILFLDFPKPVSLVAHNGSRFDFPLLKAELNRLNCVDDFQDLQCIDSLSAVKDIDALIEREDITEITRLAEHFTVDDLDDELLEEGFNPSKRQRPVECNGGNEVTHSPSRPHESSSHVGRGNHHTLEVSAVPLLTPVKNRAPGQTNIPSTPTKSAQPLPQPHTPETSQPATPGTSGFHAKVTKESSKVCRTLTYDSNHKRKYGVRKSYSQSNLYKRLFDSEYLAHRAESDAEALLTICGHYGSRFVEWADTFATAFSTVEPMWVKRKSFNTSQFP